MLLGMCQWKEGWWYWTWGGDGVGTSAGMAHSELVLHWSTRTTVVELYWNIVELLCIIVDL